MALVESKLRNALSNAWRQPTDSYAVAASRVAAAYAHYAQDATSCAGGTPLPAAVLSAQQVLRTALTAAYASSNFSAEVMVQKFSTAISVFWLTPPIAFIGASTPGVVTTAIQPILYAALLGVIRILEESCRQLPGPSVEYAAQLWASAIHNWSTTQVVVAHSPPSACVAPIT